MTDYISREDVLALADDYELTLPDDEIFFEYIDPKKVAAIPAADVRPVVLCRDCEHNNHCLTQEFVDDCGKTPLDRNTFFCADGERKSNV